MSKQPLNIKKTLTLVGTNLAFFIGAGFATGQEVVQYFVSYGWQFIFIVIIAISIYEYSNWSFIRAGAMCKLEQGNDIFYWYGGKLIGGFYDYFGTFYLLLSLIVMCGGAASTGNEQFGWRPWVGACILVSLVVITVLLGLQGIVDILGKLGPLIIAMIFFICIYTIIRDGSDILTNMESIQSGQVKIMRVGNNFLSSAISYGGFVLLWCTPFVSELGAKISYREVKLGTFIAYIIIGISIVIMTLALVTNVSDIALADIPTLTMAAMISPRLATIFSIIVFMGTYTSAVPLLWIPVTRFTKEGTIQFRILTIVLGIAAVFITLFLPYKNLVNLVYGAGGYIGIFLIILAAFTDIRLFLGKRAPGDNIIKSTLSNNAE